MPLVGNWYITTHHGPPMLPPITPQQRPLSIDEDRVLIQGTLSSSLTGTFVTGSTIITGVGTTDTRTLPVALEHDMAVIRGAVVSSGELKGGQSRPGRRSDGSHR